VRIVNNSGGQERVGKRRGGGRWVGVSVRERVAGDIGIGMREIDGGVLLLLMVLLLLHVELIGVVGVMGVVGRIERRGGWIGIGIGIGIVGR